MHFFSAYFQDKEDKHALFTNIFTHFSPGERLSSS